jgi:hypothetical protein
MGARKLPGNERQPTLPESNREMYENMPFQRKVSRHLNDCHFIKNIDQLLLM